MRALGLVVMLLVVGGCSSEAPRTVALDFEKDELGKVPAGFSTALTGGGAEVAWVVSEDETARSGRHVLLQESQDATDYRFPMCIYEGVTARDLRATVKFKSIAGKVDQASGLVIRSSPENYYVVRANPLEENVAIFKTVKGVRTRVIDSKVAVTAGDWHELGVELRGSHFNVTLDGRLVLVGEDRTFTVGRVGVWTKSDSVSAFDDLRIEPLDPN